jgi:hypothetical protein
MFVAAALLAAACKSQVEAAGTTSHLQVIVSKSQESHCCFSPPEAFSRSVCTKAYVHFFLNK